MQVTEEIEIIFFSSEKRNNYFLKKIFFELFFFARECKKVPNIHSGAIKNSCKMLLLFLKDDIFFHAAHFSALIF